MTSSVKHFIDLSEVSAPELRRILDASAAIKARRKKGERASERPLVGKVSSPLPGSEICPALPSLASATPHELNAPVQ